MWNHTYDGDNLKQAIDFVREFEHKLVACRCADDLIAHVTDRSPNDAPGGEARVRSALNVGLHKEGGS
jgi:hypothetical protein